MRGKARDEFEEWARVELSYSEDDLHREDGDSEYFWPATQTLSKCWQASRAALVVELPDDFFNTGSGAAEGFAQGIDYARQALADAGVTVK